jgi:hypothetical protein
MGWASGGQVMQEIIDLFQDEIKDDQVRYRLYKGVINALEGNDWDTQDEFIGSDDAYDKALKDLHPDWGLD